jgi:hypothetical protein
MLRARSLLIQNPALLGQHARAFSALPAPKETAPSAAQGKKAKPAKIKTFKIWRYDPEQKNQKPYSVD